MFVPPDLLFRLTLLYTFMGTNTIGRLYKVIPKSVYAVVIWLTGLIFVELPACGVYTLEVLKILNF